MTREPFLACRDIVDSIMSAGAAAAEASAYLEAHKVPKTSANGHAAAVPLMTAEPLGTLPERIVNHE